MPDTHFAIDLLFAIDTRPDPAWEEATRRLWTMSTDQRRAAMYARRLSLRPCLHWASHAPHEVPRLDGDRCFVAIDTPEAADHRPAPSSARSRP
jgi:hypothetical protein